MLQVRRIFSNIVILFSIAIISLVVMTDVLFIKQCCNNLVLYLRVIAMTSTSEAMIQDSKFKRGQTVHS